MGWKYRNALKWTFFGLHTRAYVWNHKIRKRNMKSIKKKKNRSTV